jgi:uncharacterized protein (TIGR02598 family)
MNTTRQPKKPTRSGFSLVEVTLALGIVTFALTILLALLGTALDTGGEVSDRREGFQAIDALRQYLADEVSFDETYEWAREADGQDLAWVTYHADDQTGNPDPDSQSVRSIWLADYSGYNTYENAREGTWLKVRLRLEDSQNPMTQSTLPADASDYPHAYLVFLAEVYEVAAPTLTPWTQDFPPNPLFTAPVVVRR